MHVWWWINWEVDGTSGSTQFFGLYEAAQEKFDREFKPAGYTLVRIVRA